MSQSFFISAASQYSGGACSSPSVAIDSAGNIAEVHVQAGSPNGLYYMLGGISGPTYSFPNGAKSFATGKSPSVALLTGPSGVSFAFIVFVDSNGNLNAFSGTVQWQFGLITPMTGSGIVPLKSGGNNISGVASASVAINSEGVIMVVYGTGGNKLFLLCGQLHFSNSTLTWNENATNYASGQSPCIAMNSGNSFVEAHLYGSSDMLYYNLGTVAASGTTVSVSYLKTNIEYPNVSMIDPGIAINSSGLLLEVHYSPTTGNLYFQQGQINGSDISINAGVCYVDAYDLDNNLLVSQPAVAMNDKGVVFAVYKTVDNHLYGSVSKFANRNNWMKDYQDKTLAKLCFPGSHDAAMSTTQGCTSLGSLDNTQTQVQNIGGQLNAGIRYFDIRPVFTTTNGSGMYSGHYGSVAGVIEGCNGESMASILSEVSTFITNPANSTEVVILKFSHYLDNSGTFFNFFFDSSFESATQKQTLINSLTGLIQQAIPAANLYVHSGSSRIVQNTLSAITANSSNGKVIILFDIAGLKDVTLNDGLSQGSQFVNSYLDLDPKKSDVGDASWVMYDLYSNTNSLSTMMSATEPSGQFYMLQQPVNHTGDMYLCSWTLTLSPVQSGNPGAYTILELAQYANGALAGQMLSNVNSKVINAATFPNIIYVDAATGNATDVCIWLNEQNIIPVS